MVFRNEDKQLLKENAALVVCKISVVGTELVYTEDDYIADWKYEDFRYVPENGFIGQFVERLLDGKFKNLPTDLILENKEINLQLGIKNPENDNVNYYDYGNFIITKIGDTDASGETSFESSDYTKKFNVAVPEDILYPCTALELANKTCSSVGVELYTDSVAYSIPISVNLNIFEGVENPDGILHAGEYCFKFKDKYYNFEIDKDLKLLDGLMYIEKYDTLVERYINDELNVVKTNLEFEVSQDYQSDYTLLVGNEIGYVDFANNDFIVPTNQFDTDANSRTIMQSIGKLAYSWVRVGEDNKVHIDFKVKDKDDVDEYNKLTPDEYYESTKQDIEYGPINKVLIGMSGAEGENVFKDISRDRLDKITIEGKSEQEISNGNNLFNVTNYSSIDVFINDNATNVVKSNNKISFTSNETKKYSGIYIKKSNYSSYIDNYDENKNYYFSVDITSNVDCDIRFVVDKVQHIKSGTTRLTYYGKLTNAILFYVSNVKANIEISNIMVSERDIPYEKYGISPSPTNPSEIKCVKGVENLCNGIESGNINSSGVPYVDANSIRSADYTKVEKNSMYCVTRDGKLVGINVSEYDNNKIFIKRTYVSSGIFTTQSNTGYIKIQLVGSVNDLIQIEKDTVSHKYYPYGRWLELKSTGENLLDISGLISQTINGVTIINDNGVITLNGTSNKDTTIDIPINLIFNANETYSFSKITKTTSSMLSLSFRDVNRGPISYTSLDSGEINTTFTKTTNTTAYYFRLYIVNNKTFNNYTLYPILKKGNEPTEYEEYKENTLTIDMQDYELCSIGDIKDTLENGVLTKRIGKKVLNGSEEIEQIWFDTGRRGFSIKLDNCYQTQTTSEKSKVISDRFITKTQDELFALDTNINGISNRRMGSWVIIRNDSTLYVNDFKTWLSNNNVTIYYVLETPETITLSSEQLQLFDGYNNITTNDDLQPNMIIDVDNIRGKHIIHEGYDIDINVETYEEHTINIFDNPITYTDELRRIAIDECDCLFGLRYTPLHIKSIGHPWFEGNDYLQLNNVDGETLYTYPFDRTIEYKGYITSELTSYAESKVEMEYSYEDSAIEIAKRTRFIVDKDSQTIKELVEKTDTQGSQITEITTNYEGITDTVKKLVNDFETTVTITNTVSNYPVVIEDAGPYNAESIVINGRCFQNGIPTTTNPIPIQTIEGINGVITTFIQSRSESNLSTEDEKDIITENEDELITVGSIYKLDTSFPYRLCSIGDIYDIIDVIKGIYIKKIEYIDNYNDEDIPEEVYTLDPDTGIKYCNELSMSTTGQFSKGASVYYVTGTEEIHNLDLGTVEFLDGYNKVTVNTNLKPTNIDVTYLNDSLFNSVYATQTDLQRTSENVVISVKSEINKDGVTKVRTETDFTFDKDGMNISKEGADTSTQITEDGMVIYSNTGSRSEELLTVHSTGVNAENVDVRTYLLIGNHSRMQDYENGTGIFFIG